MANILLIDDHPAVRHGLGLVLSSKSHTICGEAGSIVETLEAIGSTSADIALLDLSLGQERGIELIAPLRASGTAVLVYSMHEDGQAIRLALDAGANGYVSKREIADVLLAAICEVLAGGSFVSARAAQALASSAPSPDDDALSERENEILSMLGNGESNASIAAAFAISVRTVETYFKRIGAKLAIKGTRELRRHAIRQHTPDAETV